MYFADPLRACFPSNLVGSVIFGIAVWIGIIAYPPRIEPDVPHPAPTLVKRNSLLALAIVDDRADVPAIKKVAQQQQEGVFHAAVLTLVRMCNPAASAALDDA